MPLANDLYRVPLRDIIPADFTLPMLAPAGVTLETRELAPGVYALLSNTGPIDNSGFVVGERGVLVVDAHINGAMARQIQAAVRAVTETCCPGAFDHLMQDFPKENNDGSGCC